MLIMLIYYTIHVVRLQQVSTTYWDILKGSVFRKIYITKNIKEKWCRQKQQHHTYFDSNKIYTELEYSHLRNLAEFYQQFNIYFIFIYILDLQELGCGDLDWIELAQDRDMCWALANAVINLRIPWNAGKHLTSWKPVSLSRRTVLYAVSK
jgi:hypothetical protein